MKRASGFVLVLVGTVGGGIAHWFIVWLIAAAYGAADLGNYSVVLAGATPIFIFLGLGLRNVYVSLSDSPSWKFFLTWRGAGMAIALLLLAAYCLAVAPYWGIFAGMAVMKVADGFLDITGARLQRLDRFTILGSLSTTHAIGSILVISVAAWFSAPVGVLLGSMGAVSFLITLITALLSRAPEMSQESPLPPEVQRRRVLGAAVPLTISTGLMSLVASIPVWFLEAHSEPHELGRFAAAAYLVVAASLMGASMQTILLTTYRQRLESNGRRSLMRLMNIHTALITAVGAPTLVIILLLGDPFLRFVYGPGFGASTLELLAFGLAALMCILGYVNSTAMLVLNLYRGQLVVTAASLVGAVAPLIVIANIGTTRWVLAGIISMVGAYAVRYGTARFLLSSRVKH